MRVIISILLALFFSTFCSAQKMKDSEVPQPVKKSFEKNFKEAKKVKWEKEKDGNYEAEFVENKKEISATFDVNGVLLETEKEMKVNELPEAIKVYVSKNYKRYKIKEASFITSPTGLITFEAEIRRMWKQKELLFDSSGNLLPNQ